MKSVTIALVGLILFGGDIAALDTFAGPPLSGRVEQRRIATISSPAEVLISNDLEHVAVIDQHGRKQRLTVDGKPGLESDAIQFVKHDGPPFGHGGVPVLYARADRGRWRLVSNGVPGPECDTWINLTSGGVDRTTIAYTSVEHLAQGVRIGRWPVRTALRRRFPSGAQPRSDKDRLRCTHRRRATA